MLLEFRIHGLPCSVTTSTTLSLVPVEDARRAADPTILLSLTRKLFEPASESPGPVDANVAAEWCTQEDAARPPHFWVPTTSTTLSLVRALEDSMSLPSRLVLNGHADCGKSFPLSRPLCTRQPPPAASSSTSPRPPHRRRQHPVYLLIRTYLRAAHEMLRQISTPNAHVLHFLNTTSRTAKPCPKGHGDDEPTIPSAVPVAPHRAAAEACILNGELSSLLLLGPELTYHRSINAALDPTPHLPALLPHHHNIFSGRRPPPPRAPPTAPRPTSTTRLRRCVLAPRLYLALRSPHARTHARTHASASLPTCPHPTSRATRPRPPPRLGSPPHLKTHWEVKGNLSPLHPALPANPYPQKMDAIVSGLIVLQALQILRKSYDKLRNVHL
ncbi:hypothetical protein B0H11DRAFT_2343024 [Mycena galericulata]|nr:hypothetical protein B0H11DRAFT_2343024 [Mycena galericulata]